MKTCISVCLRGWKLRMASKTDSFWHLVERFADQVALSTPLETESSITVLSAISLDCRMQYLFHSWILQEIPESCGHRQ